MSARYKNGIFANTFTAPTSTSANGIWLNSTVQKYQSSGQWVVSSLPFEYLVVAGGGGGGGSNGGGGGAGGLLSGTSSVTFGTDRKSVV